MALPKRRHSKARRDKRRGQQKLAKPSLIHCPRCGAFKALHYPCLKCGFYKDRQVLEIKTEEKGKKEKE
ncbi:MAG: 50S ribosomal protein L32 [Candidatus Omnitrophota bacterium]|nr:MAG: 50S ribosomal protein L32 [Candidatus Omnitrophota bacterium]